MKLWMKTALGLAVMVLPLIMAGCGGGGIDSGMPTDTTPGVPVPKVGMRPNAGPGDAPPEGKTAPATPHK